MQLISKMGQACFHRKKKIPSTSIYRTENYSNNNENNKDDDEHTTQTHTKPNAQTIKNRGRVRTTL